MLINNYTLILERNKEQYLLSQSNNTHLIMNNELIYMEDCVLDLINSTKFNKYLIAHNIHNNKILNVHLYFFQTSLRLFFLQLAINKQLFKSNKNHMLFYDKNKCKCNHLYNNRCICLINNHFYTDDEKELRSLLIVVLYYIFESWKNNKEVGFDIFEINYQPTLSILQCGYEI